MKNIITSLVIMVISLSVFGQVTSPQTAISSSRVTGAKPVDNAQFKALKHQGLPSSGSSRALQTFALDYDAVDEFETTNEGGVYQRFIWDLNTRYDDQDTNRFAMTWDVVRFDTIIGLDAQGNIASYPRSSTSVVIDSVQLFVTHENTQGTPDTIKISVYQWQGTAGLAVNAQEDITNTTLWDTLIITTTSLSPAANQLTILTVEPHLTLNYPNNRFLVGVHFYGDTANHTFTLLAGYGDRCGDACQAYPSVLDLNSLYRMIAWSGTTDLTGINRIAYNCNGNTIVGEEEECELFPAQNFAITPFITINPVLTSSISISDNTICPGESVNLSVTPVGGTGPYSVSWAPTTGLTNPFSPTTGASVTTTTTFVATIADNGGDTITKSVTVTVNAISINAGADVNIACGEDTSVIATVSGVVSGATFVWSNGKNTLNNTGLGAGCYTITAQNSFGCSASDQVCVVIPGVDQVLNFITNLASNIGCKNVPVNFDNTSKRKTGWVWLWDFDDNGNISTSEEATWTFAENGSYTVTLSADSAGCTVSSATKTVTINTCIGIEETWLSSHVELYPNPTTGMVTLSFKDVDGKSGVVGVYDITGKLTLEEQLSVAGNTQKVIDLTNLPDGVYFVKVQLGDDVMVRRLNVTR